MNCSNLSTWERFGIGLVRLAELCEARKNLVATDASTRCFLHTRTIVPCPSHAFLVLCTRTSSVRSLPFPYLWAWPRSSHVVDGGTKDRSHVLLVHVVVTSQGRLGRDRLSVGVGLNPVRVPFHVSLNPVRGGFDWRSGREERGSGIDVGWTCRWQRPSKEGWPRQKRWTCKRSWTCRWTSW